MNSECLFAHLVTGSAARKPTNFRWKQQSEEAAFRPLSVQTHKEWVPRIFYHLLATAALLMAHLRHTRKGMLSSKSLLVIAHVIFSMWLHVRLCQGALLTHLG